MKMRAVIVLETTETGDKVSKFLAESGKTLEDVRKELEDEMHQEMCKMCDFDEDVQVCRVTMEDFEGLEEVQKYYGVISNSNGKLVKTGRGNTPAVYDKLGSARRVASQLGKASYSVVELFIGGVEGAY